MFFEFFIFGWVFQLDADEKFKLWFDFTLFCWIADYFPAYKYLEILNAGWKHEVFILKVTLSHYFA